MLSAKIVIASEIAVRRRPSDETSGRPSDEVGDRSLVDFRANVASYERERLLREPDV
jgi:hypothetical protein